MRSPMKIVKIEPGTAVHAELLDGRKFEGVVEGFDGNWQDDPCHKVRENGTDNVWRVRMGKAKPK